MYKALHNIEYSLLHLKKLEKHPKHTKQALIQKFHCKFKQEFGTEVKLTVSLNVFMSIHLDGILLIQWKTMKKAERANCVKILSKSGQVPFNHRGFMAFQWWMILPSQGAISINNSLRWGHKKHAGSHLHWGLLGDNAGSKEFHISTSWQCCYFSEAMYVASLICNLTSIPIK